MKRTIVFIHGMFLTPKSWDGWVDFFTARGYRCVAPAWPWHDGEPRMLRRHVPAETGRIGLREVVARYADFAEKEPQAPILIGHSVGGLVAQILVGRGLAKAGVCLSSVAPNGMMTLDWNYLKNSTAILNPLKGKSPYPMTEKGFQETFCNTMTPKQTHAAYEEYAVHESRKVLRDCLGRAGRVDTAKPHAPLLFVSGDQDHIIPEKLDRKNASAYAPGGGIVDFKKFPGRGHFIQGQPGWEQVAEYVDDWLASVA